jgi:hypothetical protein
MFRNKRMAVLALSLMMLASCSRSESILPAAPVEPAPIGTQFDPQNTGSVRGRVIWEGVSPNVPKIQAVVRSNLQGVTVANPHTPRIDTASQGLAEVVVFLRGVAPERSRPWDQTPVRIEIADGQLRLRSEEGKGHAVGFVRVGETVSLDSHDTGIQMVRARGAEFFTLPFPVPNQPVRRVFDQAGLVELTNGAGYYWQSADLFVCEHPYYARTQPDGSFHLPQVPPGEYELVAWTRDWHVTDTERDPETGLIIRQGYRPPVEKSVRVRITSGKETPQELRFQLSEFNKNK